MREKGQMMPVYCVRFTLTIYILICFRMIFECLAFFAQAGGLCGGQRAEELPYFISHPNPSGQQLQQNLHNNVYLLLIHISV